MAMSMVLLTFTLQFNHLEPSYGYVALTLVYFILSQYKGTYFNFLNPLNVELNPIFHLLALLGAHHILHIRRIRDNIKHLQFMPG
jgi:hypothetical protein